MFVKEFKVAEEADTDKMKELVDAMHELLEAIDEGIVPNNADYTLTDLSGYLSSLILGQRKSIGRTKPGSWAVAPDDGGMASDARVDFIFKPTYISTAILVLCLAEYPLLALNIPGYSAALKRGMLFCSARGLQGHGYEADEGAIDGLRILSLGKIPWLLCRHPDFCPKLKSVIDSVALDMETRLFAGSAIGDWGVDYSEGFRSALETLKIKNDPEFMRRLQQSRQDSETFSMEDLPW